VQVQWELSAMLARRKEYQPAAALLREALKVLRHHASSLAKGSRQLRRVERMIDHTLLELGLTLLDAERFDEGVETFGALVLAHGDGDLAPVHNVGLGNAWLMAGDPLKAAEEYTRALGICDRAKPCTPRLRAAALLNLGVASLLRGALEDASAFVKRALAVDSEFSEAQVALERLRVQGARARLVVAFVQEPRGAEIGLSAPQTFWLPR